MHYNTMIVLAGAGVLGACSGLVGSFAVLRRRALTGDALAHAALPGLCVAFLLVGEKSLPAMLLGALASGLLGIAVISAITMGTRIKEDAAIGLVLSVSFGAGVVLLRMIQNLSTTGSKAGLESFVLGKTAGMIAQDVYLIAGVALLCLLLILILYKEFKVVAFDPAFAQVQGWPAYWIDLLLMAMIAVTVVIGLPAVGVVLMSALLIIPAATARFWTQNLGATLVLSALLGVAIGLAGTAVTANFPYPAGPSIVLVGGGFFLTSVLFAPRRGVVARILNERSFRRQLSQQRLLSACYELIEPELRQGRSLEECALAREVLFECRTWSTVEFENSLRSLAAVGAIAAERRDGIALTRAGLVQAAELVRRLRLSELVLQQHSGASAAFAELDMSQGDEWIPETLLSELDEQLKSTGRFPVGLNASEGEQR